jgi:hypothetical protein
VRLIGEAADERDIDRCYARPKVTPCRRDPKIKLKGVWRKSNLPTKSSHELKTA